jgi:hypothetical protein
MIAHLNARWRTPFAFAALVLLVATGCGTGEYDARLQTTINNVGRRAAIESFLTQGTTDVSPDSGVRFRLPAIFDGSSKSLAPGEARATIGGVALPGLVRASERAIDDPGGKYSVGYVYFAAVPKEGKPQDALQNELRTAIAGVLPTAKWETAQLEKLSGGSVSFPLLVATGPQAFDASQNGGANEQHEGRLEIYLVPADKHWVLIGWRAPTTHAGKYQLFDAVRAAMATVEVTPGMGGGSTPAAAAAAAATPAPAAAGNAAAPANAGEGLPPGGAVGAAAGLAPVTP